VWGCSGGREVVVRVERRGESRGRFVLRVERRGERRRAKHER
jgi:hypothetical protein